MNRWVETLMIAQGRRGSIYGRRGSRKESKLCSTISASSVGGKEKLYWKVLGEADTRSDALAASTVASQSCPVARATQSGGRVDWQSSMLDPRSGNAENLHREEWVGELDDALHVYAPNLENKGPVMICAAACSSILHFFETNVYTRPQ